MMFATAASGQQALPSSDAVLRPGDVVQLQVWRQPELTGEFEVTTAWGIGHPLLRDVIVAGRTLDEVEEALRIFLFDFSHDPNFVFQAFFQVAVGGQVRVPDVYPLRAGTTIAEAVAQAGGVTEQGRPDRVILRREGAEYPIDFTSAVSPLRDATVRSGDEILVTRRRDVWRDYVVPVISVAGSIAAIIQLTQP